MNLKKLIIFGNIYISLCAVIMCLYTYFTFSIKPDIYYVMFLFFASMTSYSFHWYLTPDVSGPSPRFNWVDKNKKVLLFFFVISFCATLILIYYLREHFLVLIVMAVLTFIYSAAKISKAPFIYLRKIIIGKTAYLAGIWTIVTTILPLIFSHSHFNNLTILFIINRFLLIYVICILFDFRDREEDSKNKVKNFIGEFSEKNLRNFYFFCLGLFFISSLLIYANGFSLVEFILNIIPGILLAFSFGHSIKTRSDYWYYFYLDGLMMLSGVLYLLKMLLS